MRNTRSKCGISRSRPFWAVLRELRYSASAKGNRLEMTLAFSSSSASNSGNLIEARAASALGQREDGTGQPHGPNKREGASGTGESVTSSAGSAGAMPLASSSASTVGNNEDDTSSG